VPINRISSRLQRLDKSFLTPRQAGALGEFRGQYAFPVLDFSILHYITRFIDKEKARFCGL
jgi:hypothetical protein